MYKSTAAVILASLLPATMAHIGMWHPSVYGFNGNGYSIVEPLANKDFNQWWFHGEIGNGPKDGAKLNFAAGKETTIELACNKRFTSYGGDGNGNNPCPSDNPSMHAGTPIKDGQLRGCGLAIAYKNNVNDVKPEDFVIFSVNYECVKYKNTVFKVPSAMPACPGGKCICAWFWQGQESANEMYMNGFDCNITDPGNGVLSKPKAPKECRDGNGCVDGPKNPLYWANRGSQNIDFSGDYNRKPAYRANWGFKDGAQDDIFEAGVQQPEGSQPNPETPELPNTSPEGCPAPVTVTVTVSKRSRPTPNWN